MLRIWHSCTKPVSLSVDRVSGKIYPFLYCFNTIVWMSRSKVVYTLLFYNFLEINKFSFNVHPLVSTVRLSMVLAMQVPRERTHAPCQLAMTVNSFAYFHCHHKQMRSCIPTTSLSLDYCVRSAPPVPNSGLILYMWSAIEIDTALVQGYRLNYHLGVRDKSETE